VSLIVAMPLQLSDAASVTPLKFFVSLFDFFAYAQAKKNNVCGAACELQWWHLVDVACVDLRCGISPQEKEVCDNGIRGVCARGKIKKNKETINLCDDGVDRCRIKSFVAFSGAASRTE